MTDDRAADVLHVVTLLSADGRYGGPQTVARTIAGGLGHEVWGGASAADLAAEETRPGERRFRAYGGSGETFSRVAVPALWWALWWRLWRRTRSSRRPDLVHVHGGSELFGLVAMAVLRLRRAPYVVQPHGMYTYPRGSVRERVARRVFIPFVRRARAVVALTDAERALLIEYGLAPEIVEVVPNGIDAGAVSAEPARDGVPTVAFVGRLQARKHPERFTAAAALLARRGVKARFVTVGADQGALAAAREADPDGIVEHLGALALDEARRVIAQAQVVVVCSDTEPFGMVAIEALASSTALVITDSCDLAAELGAAGAALVTATGPDAIADGVSQLLDSAVSRAAQIAAGVALVRERYSMEVVTPRWSRLYRRAVTPRPNQTLGAS